MAYKQNFGPSRKSGKAMSMCGVSRVMSPLNKEGIGRASENAYSNPTIYASPDYSVNTMPSQGMTIDGSTGKSSGGKATDIKKDGEASTTKLGRLNAKKQAVIDGGGNKAKEARIQGRIDRTTIRQKERGERIVKRNERKKDRTVKREKIKDKVHDFFSSDKYDINKKTKSSGMTGPFGPM